MLKKVCCDCQQGFVVEEAKAWAVRCLPCWIAQQDRTGKRKVEALQAQVEYWQGMAHGTGSHPQVTVLQKKVEALESENMKLKVELIKTRSKTARRSRSSLPEDWRDYLPRLIQLCHPDRHAGSEAANRATVWLLGLKKQGMKQ